MRRQRSKWSEKNKALAKSLEERGLMTDFGREKISAAQKNAQWDAPKPPAIAEEQLARISLFERAWARPREFCRPSLIRADNLRPGIF